MSYLNRGIWKINQILFHLSVYSLIKKNAGLELERFGTLYGGWTVPANYFNKDSICYCAGAGEDISFDLGLIQRYSCNIFSFDPTPRAEEYIQKIAGNIQKYVFFKKGLWSEKKTLRFFAPKNPAHVSHSVLNLQRTECFFDAPCDRLSNIMNDLDHKRLDLLKLNIEGAEWEVLESILQDRIDIRVLCFSLEKPLPFYKFKEMIKRLGCLGLHLAYVEGWRITMVK